MLLNAGLSRFACLGIVPVVVAGFSPLLGAQQPCSGHSLKGVVQDSTAAVIPGASVQLDASSAAVQTSGGDGRFFFRCVPLGSHRLKVTAAGFAPSERVVASHNEAEVRVVLVPADSVSITVSAQEDAPPLGGLTGTTLSGSQLDTLADDPDDLQRELQQLAAASGGSPSGTVISVDGFQGDSPLPPKSSIARVEVNADLFSAENRQPPFDGGQIQVFTKPGAKYFHGSLFATNSSSWMNARDPFSNAPAAIGKQRYGFTLNGPVRREGSNFSVALEHRSIDEVAVVNAVTLDASGNQVSIVANVPTPQRLWIGTARLDAQLGPKNTAVLSYSVNVNSLSNVGVGGTTLREAGYASGQYSHAIRFADTTTITANLLHQGRVLVEFRGEIDSPNAASPQVQVAGGFTGGGATLGPQHIRQTRIEWDDNLLYSHGRHSLKAGLQFFTYVERQRLTTNFNGTYIFGGGSAPVLDASGNATSATTVISGIEQYRRTLLNLPGGTPTQYSSVSGSPQVRFTEIYPALFIQDDMRLGSNLTVSGGLRYFYANLPFQNDGITPRVGATWAPRGSKSVTVSGHLGLFSGHSANGLEATEAELLREDGVNRITSLVYSPVYGAPVLTGSSVIHAVRTLAPNYNSNQTLMAESSVTKTLGAGFSLSISGIYVRAWHQERTLNVNSPLSGSPTGARPGVANLNVLQLQSSANEAGDIEVAGIGNQKLKAVQFFVGVVRNHVLGDSDDSAFTTPQSSSTNAGEYSLETGNSLWQNFASVTVHLPEKVILSTNYSGNGNSPFNLTTGFDNNGDGDFNDRPQFARPGQPGSVVTPFGRLVASGGVGVLARNRASLPWSFHVDANVQRTFTLTHDSKAAHKQTLTANVRSSNLLNHTNVTAEGGVLGSPFFLVPYAADNGRRVEGGIRYSF